MPAPNVHIELVHDPTRHRAVIGWSSDPALLRVTAEQLISEAERRAEQFTGLDDIAAEGERAEAGRLRRVLELVLPGGARGGGASE
jgi:hypothetical protein